MHRCIPVNFVKFPRTLFLTEYLRWFPLSFASILSKWFKSCPQKLIGLLFSLRFPEPCLNTSVTLANLEDAANFDEPIDCMKGVRIHTFIGLYFHRFNYGKITSRKNPYLNTYSHSNCFVNFKACIFSKIISIFFQYSYMWVWFLHYFMKFWCLQEHYFFYQLVRSKNLKSIEKNF